MSEGQIVVLDEGKMLEKIVEQPAQFEKAWTTLWIKEPPVKAEGVKNLILVGMGGSGVANELVIDLFGATGGAVPITAWHDYQLPSWVNESTLVIATSYSGETEETLDAVRLACERKAKIVAISKGGKLEELSKINGFPLLKIDYDGPPRTAIGHLYGSLLTVLAKLELINLTEKAYFQALDELKKTIFQKAFPQKAEDLAISLNNKVPLILAYPPLAAIAGRWQNQFNENSKTLAIRASLPEAGHNLVAGLEFPIPEKLTALLLESKYGFSRNIAHKKALQKVFSDKEISFIPLSVRSSSALAEQLLLIHFGDLLSFYLAGVYGVDPTPIEAIDKLKEEMAKL